VKRIAESVKRWGDDWSVDQTIGPLGDISYASDKKDAENMRMLSEWPLPPAYIERRKINRRKKDRR